MLYGHPKERISILIVPRNRFEDGYYNRDQTQVMELSAVLLCSSTSNRHIMAGFSIGHVPVFIKHRVQNPRRVTKPEPIASTHAQMGPRIAHLLVGVSISSMELATKILRA